LTEEDFKKRDQRWKNGNNEMKERKPDVDRKEDRRRQEGGYKRNAKERPSGNIQTQNRVYDGTAPRWKGWAIHYATSATPIYPSTTNMWECKEAEDQRTYMDMIKEQWIDGKKGMEKMIDYAKEIGLYNGI
jgi:hypothetical protein